MGEMPRPALPPPLLPSIHRCYRDADGFLIVYDITNHSSYADSARCLETVRRLTHSRIHTMLVGNKCDLKDCQKMSTDEAIVYTESYSTMFLETSAKDGTNVKAAFLNLITGQHCIYHL